MHMFHNFRDKLGTTIRHMNKSYAFEDSQIWIVDANSLQLFKNSFISMDRDFDVLPEILGIQPNLNCVFIKLNFELFVLFSLSSQAL